MAESNTSRFSFAERVESGYVSMVELEKLPRGVIEATLYNRLLDMARHRFCLSAEYNGKEVKFRYYWVIEDTYLYRLDEEHKLEVIS